MSNYLDQLVAKNLNPIDTVQPFLLSVFGFLPESPVEMGSEESWGINPEIVMGDSGDSPMTTGLETSPETQILTNSDIVQPLEWRSLATDVQTSNNDTSYPPSTGLTPTPTQDSEQTATAASFLVDKSDSKLSSTQPFSQPAEILPTTDKIPPTPNIQLFSSDSADSASGRFTQKESEAISSPGVPQTQPVTESSGQQPVEINQVFPSPAEPKVVREQLSSHQSQLQPAVSLSTMGKVPSVLDAPPLLPALTVETNIPLSYPVAEKLITPTTESLKQQPIEINRAVSRTQSPKVVSPSQSLTQPQSESVTREPTSERVLPTNEKQALMPATHLETNTPKFESAVKLQEQSVPLLSRQPAIEITRLVPSSPSSMVMREELSSHQSQLKQVAIAPDKSQVLGAIETRVLTPALTVETNTREAHPAVEQLTQPATESKEPQSVKIHPTVSQARSPKLFSSEQSLTQLKPEPVSRERTSAQVPTQGIAPLHSIFQDNFPHPTPNIVQPIDDDTRRSSVFVSASRQEQQQRESFGNSGTPPTIQVSIGRMEIRTPPPPPPRSKPRPKTPVMSLDEYLRQRSRGR